MADMGDKSIPGYANPKCYAKALCECSSKVNDEHYVSENALEKITRESGTIYVQNLGFQKERNVIEPMGTSSLTSRVLCKYHNGRLSDYDTEFGKMVAALDAIDEHAGDKDAAAEHFFVDGDLIERCFLKTLCGGLYSGNFLVPPEDKMRGKEPPREWLDILYKGAEFQEPRGLYLKQLVDGEVLETTKFQMSIIPLFSADQLICGLSMRLYGFEFTLLMCGLQAGAKTEFDKSLFRPEGLLIVGCNKQLIFRWKGGHRSDPLVLKFLSRTWVHEE